MYDEPIVHDTPPHYYYFSGNANAFATEPACVDKKDGPFSYLAFLGCQAQKNIVSSINRDAERVGGASNAVQTNLRNSLKRDPVLGTSHAVQKSFSDTIFGQANAIQQTGKDWLGSFVDAVKSTGNWAGSGFDMLGKYWPFIAIGGVLIIVILLMKRR